MKLLLLIVILTFIALLSLFVVVALYRHKKSSAGRARVFGEPGEVTIDLNPEGSVLVHGELWRARSRDGSLIPTPTRVRVTGVEGHLLLVEPLQ